MQYYLDALIRSKYSQTWVASIMEVLAIMVSNTTSASGAFAARWSKSALLIVLNRVGVPAQARKLRGLSRNQSVVPIIEPGPNWNCLHVIIELRDSMKISKVRQPLINAMIYTHGTYELWVKSHLLGNAWWQHGEASFRLEWGLLLAIFSLDFREGPSYGILPIGVPIQWSGTPSYSVHNLPRMMHCSGCAISACHS